jgi:NAD-dependent dihydropyrimidine dehydrogenase PreA subunit
MHWQRLAITLHGTARDLSLAREIARPVEETRLAPRGIAPARLQRVRSHIMQETPAEVSRAGILRRGWNLITGALFRWFPCRATPGLRAVGAPGPDSPVLVTGNYTLTVARLLRGIRGLRVWLLVADSGGINVWCASAAGRFTEKSIIEAVRSARLATRVAHRELMLPPLAAPGVDRAALEAATGFRARFGPVRAADLPAYLATGRKTAAMLRADFSYRHRLDMLVSMNFVIWLALAIPCALLQPTSLLHLTGLFWGLAAVAYLVCPWNPRSSGLRRAMTLAGLVVLGYGAAGWLQTGDPLARWGWMLAGVGMVGAICFDLAGIVSPVQSDAERVLQEHGVKQIGTLLVDRPRGSLAFDAAACVGCQVCLEVCPLGVLEPDAAGERIELGRPGECFACGACVRQCPTGALALTSEEESPAR